MEESKSNVYLLNLIVIGKGENHISSRLSKNPNKAKFLYTDNFY
jgi:hypothetical protein